MKKKGFTILEVIIAITSFFLILVVIINIYTKMMQLKYNIQARTNITQDTYFVIEKINLLLKDYTIDYEEYFNRTNVGCDSYETNFIRNVGSGTDNGHCDNFTAYGNMSNIDGIESSTHKLYFCSSIIGETTPKRVIQNPYVQNGSGCLNTGKQSFGQYFWQFRDVKKDVDTVAGAQGDDDDEHVLKGPVAIADTANVKELYLISQNGTSKILIRRTLVESGDWNYDGIISGDNEKLYTLEILKLRGFDAGNNHNFDVNTSEGVYDGKIDTRACDYAQGYRCNGTGIGPLYPGYNMPKDENDGRVNLFQKNITISDRNIIISPNKNPQYALAQETAQINPYFTINLTSKLYGAIRQKRLGMETINDFQMNIQTTFNTKNFYTK